MSEPPGLKRRKLDPIINNDQIPDQKPLLEPLNNNNELSIPKETEFISQYFTNIDSLITNIKKYVLNNEKFRWNKDFDIIISILMKPESEDELKSRCVLIVIYFEFKGYENLISELRLDLEKIKLNSILYLLDKSTTKFCQCYSKLREIFIFFVKNNTISLEFKIHIIKNCTYTITIFKDKAFTKSIVEGNREILNIIIKNSKNIENLKYYDLDESIKEILLCFYEFIGNKTLLDLGELTFNPDKKYKEINLKIIRFCFENNYDSIINIITIKEKSILLLPSTIFLAFTYGSYDFLKNNIKNKNLRKNLVEYEIFSKILELRRKKETFLDFVFFLNAIKDEKLNNQVQKLLYDDFREFLITKNNTIFLIYNVNPLLIVLLLSQSFYRLSLHCDNLHFGFENISKILKNQCKAFIKNYPNFNHIKQSIFQIYYPSEKSIIDLVFEEETFFYDLFEGSRLYKIISMNINDYVKFDINLFAVSTSFSFIDKTKFLKPEKNVNTLISKVDADKMIPLLLKNDRITIKNYLNVEPKHSYDILAYVRETSNHYFKNEKKKHFYQRSVFDSSLSIKLILDFLFFMAIFVYVYLIAGDYMKLNDMIMLIKDDYSKILKYDNNAAMLSDSSLNEIYQRDKNKPLNMTEINRFNITNYTNERWDCFLFNYNKTRSIDLSTIFIDECLNYMAFINYLELENNKLTQFFTVVLISTFDFILRLFYKKIILKQWHIYAMQIFDITTFVLSIILLVLSKDLYSTSDHEDLPNIRLKVTIVTVFFALLMFNLWLKATQYVKYTRKFGPTIKILELMTLKTIKFLILLVMNIAAFTSVMYILFSNEEDFSNFGKAIRNLYGFALGNFSFYDNDSNLYTVTISIITMVYLIGSNLILLNLLIAILSNVYNELSKRTDYENAYTLYLVKKDYMVHKIFGTFILFPRTINCFLLPIHLIVCIANHEAVTRFFFNLFYSFYFIIFLFIFIISHILIIPIAWSKILFMIVREKYYFKFLKEKLSFHHRVFHFIIWFIFGIFYLIIALFWDDIPSFFINSYDLNKQNNIVESFSSIEISTLTNLIIEKYHNKINECDLDEFKRHYKEKLETNLNNNINGSKSPELRKKYINNIFNTGLEEFEKKKKKNISSENEEKKFLLNNIMENIYYKENKTLKEQNNSKEKNIIPIELLYNIVIGIKKQFQEAKNVEDKKKLKYLFYISDINLLQEYFNFEINILEDNIEDNDDEKED